MSNQPQSQQMYLGVGTAKPTSENSNYPSGLNQAVLVFVKETGQAGAQKLAIQHLEATGWQEVVIDKINPVENTSLHQAPPEIAIAYEKAEQDGSHGMVLELPKKPVQ